MVKSWTGDAARRLRKGAVLLAAAICTATAAGCGGGAPPPETPQREREPARRSAATAPGAPLPELPAQQGEPAPEAGATGPEAAPPAEGGSADPALLGSRPGTTHPGGATGTAAQVRLQLARHDVYRPWYSDVGEIEVDASGLATVATSLATGARPTAEEVCRAVLGSGFVRRARVSYGSGSSVACG